MKLKDKDIRFKYILENKDFFKSGIFINEYDINGKNRVDFAILKDDKFIGFEIKSEADSLKRFIPQLRTYLKFFDFIYLVIHNSHVKEVETILDKYGLKKVGIISVDGNISFTTKREAIENNKICKVNSLIKNLKQEDLITLCENKKLKITKTYKEVLVNTLVGKISSSEALEMLRKRLKQDYLNICPKCKSSLVYKTTTKNTKTYTEKSTVKGKLKIIYYEAIFTSKVCRCIECENEFKSLDTKCISKKIKYVKDYNTP